MPKTSIENGRLVNVLIRVNLTFRSTRLHWAEIWQFDYRYCSRLSQQIGCQDSDRIRSGVQNSYVLT